MQFYRIFNTKGCRGNACVSKGFTGFHPVHATHRLPRLVDHNRFFCVALARAFSFILFFAPLRSCLPSTEGSNPRFCVAALAANHEDAIPSTCDS